MAGVSNIDVDRARAPAFGLADDLAPFQSDWHTHRLHQVLYAVHGVLHLEVDGGSWLLPPQRAAFLTANTRHQVVADRKVALRTLYISPDFGPLPSWDCRVFTVGPLAKELFLYAVRFSHQHDPQDPLLRTYFQTVLALALEWTEHGVLPFRLPVPQSDPLLRVTRLIRKQLGSPLSVPDLARAAAMSERTLHRRFQAELGISPHAYLHTARMLSALDRLTDPQVPITSVALDVGFETPSAFSHAFVAFAGETPRDYRQRVLASDSPRSAIITG